MVPTVPDERVPGSFRDPQGFVFRHDGSLYRQVNPGYREHYEILMGSGLYRELVERRSLISHEEVNLPDREADAYRILRPEPIPFISFPYEWCFSQLKDAALLTLDIQSRALEHGMSLKDASAYNIQFQGGTPTLIDTLSFEKCRDGEPWIAYRQFCQHFLAPMALMAGTDGRLGGLSRLYLDGIPLDLAARLLPFSTRLKPGLLMHIHLHAKSQRAFSGKAAAVAGKEGGMKMGKRALVGLIQSLRGTVEGLKLRHSATEWGGYYKDNSYSPAALDSKQEIVSSMLRELQPGDLWDIGANSGLYSRIASSAGIRTVSFDLDFEAVEANYLEARAGSERNILPLMLDLTNPSPALGWGNLERPSLLQRGPADAVMALALIHHLAISNNLPLERISEFFHGICRHLIIEFVPKADVQVRRLLATRPDIFPGYHVEGFLASFSRHFRVKACRPVADSQRTIYLMEGLAT